jgi:hypothetical protein
MLQKTLYFLIEQALKGDSEALNVLGEEHLAQQINYSEIANHSQEGGRLCFSHFIEQSSLARQTNQSAERLQIECLHKIFSHTLSNPPLLAYILQKAHQNGFQLPILPCPKSSNLYFTNSAQQLVRDTKQVKHFIKEENEEHLQSLFSTLLASSKSSNPSNNTYLLCFAAQIAYAFLLKNKQLSPTFLKTWEQFPIKDKAIVIYLYSAQAVWRPSANISTFSDTHDLFGVKPEATFVSHIIQECLFLQHHQPRGAFSSNALEHFFKILPPTEKSQFFELSPDLLSEFLLFYEHNFIENTKYKQTCIDFLNSYTTDSLKGAISQLPEISSRVVHTSGTLSKLLLTAQYKHSQPTRRAL